MQNTLELVDMVNFLYERATKEVKMNFEVGMVAICKWNMLG